MACDPADFLMISPPLFPVHRFTKTFVACVEYILYYSQSDCDHGHGVAIVITPRGLVLVVVKKYYASSAIKLCVL